MATGLDPERMSYRRFQTCLRYAHAVRAWLDGRGELPDLAPVKPPDLSAIGL